MLVTCPEICTLAAVAALECCAALPDIGQIIRQLRLFSADSST